jgi:hypothetical protein
LIKFNHDFYYLNFIEMSKKSFLMTLLVGFCCLFSQSSQGQISNLQVAQPFTYSYDFVNEDLVIFQHNGSLIDAYYTIQKVSILSSKNLQNISKIDYYHDESRMTLYYDGNSKLTFSTHPTDSPYSNELLCAGLSQNINDNGFSKKEVLKLVASLK